MWTLLLPTFEPLMWLLSDCQGLLTALLASSFAGSGLASTSQGESREHDKHLPSRPKLIKNKVESSTAWFKAWSRPSLVLSPGFCSRTLFHWPPNWSPVRLNSHCSARVLNKKQLKRGRIYLWLTVGRENPPQWVRHDTEARGSCHIAYITGNRKQALSGARLCKSSQSAPNDLLLPTRTCPLKVS